MCFKSCAFLPKQALKVTINQHSLSQINDNKVLFFFFIFPELSEDPFKEERKILIFKYCNIKG